MSDIITFRGEKELWNRFVHNIKLRKKEVWEVMKPFIEANSEFDYNKIKHFVETALSQYEDEKLVDKIIEIKEVPVTDGKFIQFPMAGYIEKDFFKEDKGHVGYSPEIHGLGHSIANGEMDYLIRKLISNDDLNRTKVKNDAIDLSFISEKAALLTGDISVLLPTTFISKLYSDRNAHFRIKHGKIPLLDDYIKLIFVSEDVIGKNVIFLSNFACLWLYTPSFNLVTGNPEALHVEIGHMRKGNKISLLVKSLGKLEIKIPREIKIFEIDKDNAINNKSTKK